MSQATNDTQGELRRKVLVVLETNFKGIAVDEMVKLVNQEVRTVLDRLESKAYYDVSGVSPLINPREIAAERRRYE